MNKKLCGGARVVMATGGSLGDLHPYIALALEMRERDLEPVIVTGEAYREKIEALGIEFQPMRPKFPGLDDPEIVGIIDRMMDPQRGAEYLFKELLVPAVRDSYADLNAAIQGASLLVTHPLVMVGPPLAQRTGIPWVSTVLAPSSLWSAYDPMVPPNAAWLHRLLCWGSPVIPRGFKKLLEALTNTWLTQFYELRKELGLPRGSNPLFEGQYSPELNLGLFSNALMKPQRDWPANTVLTGFPFYDRRDNRSMEPELLEFLADGPPPIVFTLGSAAVHLAGDFFRESVKAASLLKRRAVLLVGNDGNRPEGPLPDGVAVFNYAPYGELLPHAAAVVHQGGVGTTGQALRAGIPMLVMPYSYDQPDNAARVRRLGVARSISRESYRAERVALELKELLENPFYSNMAGAVAGQVRAEDGAVTAVCLILRLLERRGLKTDFTSEQRAVA